MSFGIETEFLTNSEMALNNGASHAEVSELLSKFTYTPTKIGEGQNLCGEAKSTFTINRTEGQEMTEAFLKYDIKASFGSEKRICPYPDLHEYWHNHIYSRFQAKNSICFSTLGTNKTHSYQLVLADLLFHNLIRLIYSK